MIKTGLIMTIAAGVMAAFTGLRKEKLNVRPLFTGGRKTVDIELEYLRDMGIIENKEFEKIINFDEDKKYCNLC